MADTMKRYLVEFWNSYSGRPNPVSSVKVVASWDGDAIQKARARIGYFGRKLHLETVYMGEARTGETETW